MPRNGQGVYSKPEGTTAVPNTTIESSKYNDVIDDLVNDANDARPISAGGTGAKTVDKAIKNLGLDVINSAQDTKITEALTTANRAVLIAEGAIGPGGGTTANLTVSSLTVNTSALVNSMRVSQNTIMDGQLKANDQVFMSKGLSVDGSIGANGNIYCGSAYFTPQGEIFGNIWGQNFGHQNLSSVIHDIQVKASAADGKATAGAICQYQSALYESPAAAITTGAASQLSQLVQPYVMIGVRIHYGNLYVRGIALKNQ